LLAELKFAPSGADIAKPRFPNGMAMATKTSGEIKWALPKDRRRFTMRKTLTKITLAASILLALSFTFGCSNNDSDDDEPYSPPAVSGFRQKSTQCPTHIIKSLPC